jgi:hypothetical protein
MFIICWLGPSSSWQTRRRGSTRPDDQRTSTADRIYGQILANHRAEYGVEPTYEMLPIAPST